MRHLGVFLKWFFVMGMFLQPAEVLRAANEAGPPPAGGGTLVANGDGVPPTDTPTHINPPDGEGIFYSVAQGFSLYVRGDVQRIETSATTSGSGIGIGMVSYDAADTFDMLISTVDPTPVEIVTHKTGAHGIWMAKYHPDSRGSITVRSAGDIATFGFRARPIDVLHSGTGDIHIQQLGGWLHADRGGSFRGAINAAHTGTGNLLIASSGRITAGAESYTYGISGSHHGMGDIRILHDGTMETVSMVGDGILGWHVGTGGNILVETTSRSRIFTQGDFATAIFARHYFNSGDLNIRIVHRGEILTRGRMAAGVFAGAGFGTRGTVDVVVEGTVRTLGQDASAVMVSHYGPLAHTQANPQNITAVISGEILGGWGSTGSGVVIETQSAQHPTLLTVTDTGHIEALSDQAIRLLTDGTNSSATVENHGTIVGTLDFAAGSGGGDDRFDNYSSNSWNLRNWYDSDGDGVRDTEGVALSDFGPGNDTLFNAPAGTLRLMTVPNTRNFDPDLSFVPPGHVAQSLHVPGVEHAALVNLETFDNAGLIDMQDTRTGGTGPVWGDRLVVTGNSAITPAMTAGPGLYRSLGGQLRIDTYLDDGVTDRTDVLVVDRAVLGTEPTWVFVQNAGGPGGLTGNGPTDGILVVHALDMAGSNPEAFRLGVPAVGGPFVYALVPGTDGWYLQTSRFTPEAAFPALAALVYREPLGLEARGFPEQLYRDSFCRNGCFNHGCCWQVRYGRQWGQACMLLWQPQTLAMADWNEHQLALIRYLPCHPHWRGGWAFHLRWLAGSLNNGTDNAAWQSTGWGGRIELAWSPRGWNHRHGWRFAVACNATYWGQVELNDLFGSLAAKPRFATWIIGGEATYLVPWKNWILAPRAQLAAQGITGDHFRLSGFPVRWGSDAWLTGRMGLLIQGWTLTPSGRPGKWQFFADLVHADEPLATNAVFLLHTQGADAVGAWWEYGASLHMLLDEGCTFLVQVRRTVQQGHLDFSTLDWTLAVQWVW